MIFLFGQNVKTNNGDQGFFLKKVDVYECLKQIMEIKDFFFKKGDEKFCAEEYRDVF